MSKKTLLALISWLVSLTLAMAGSAAATNPIDTTILTRENAREILKQTAPDVNVISVEKSAIEGLWEIAVSGNNGNKGVVYLDATKNFLIQGQIINLATRRNLTQDKYEEISKVDVSRIPLQDSLILGDAKAKNRVFVFTDPDCPYCVKFHDEIRKVVEKRKDIVFYLKLFPLASIHPKSHDKAVAIECEKDNDKAVKMLEDAYAKKEIPKTACGTKAVDENTKLAEALGINGTPTVIFSDGKIRNGMSADDVVKTVDNLKL